MTEPAVDCSAPSPSAPGSLYLAYRIEPHWVAKDGQRFLTTSEHDRPLRQRRRPPARGARRVPGRRGSCCPAAASIRTTKRRLAHPGQVAAAATRPRGLRAVRRAPRPRRRHARAPRAVVEPARRHARRADAAVDPTTHVSSAFRHPIHEVGDGLADLVEVDQEGVVAVRRVDLDVPAATRPPSAASRRSGAAGSSGTAGPTRCRWPGSPPAPWPSPRRGCRGRGRRRGGPSPCRSRGSCWRRSGGSAWCRGARGSARPRTAARARTCRSCGRRGRGRSGR